MSESSLTSKDFFDVKELVLEPPLPPIVAENEEQFADAEVIDKTEAAVHEDQLLAVPTDHPRKPSSTSSSYTATSSSSHPSEVTVKHMDSLDLEPEPPSQPTPPPPPPPPVVVVAKAGKARAPPPPPHLIVNSDDLTSSQDNILSAVKDASVAANTEVKVMPIQHVEAVRSY